MLREMRWGRGVEGEGEGEVVDRVDGCDGCDVDIDIDIDRRGEGRDRTILGIY